jgi:hypothetical protein
MSKENFDSFEKELQQLLSKYNALIAFSCDNNHHKQNLSGEKIIVMLNGEEYTLSEGWVVDRIGF